MIIKKTLSVDKEWLTEIMTAAFNFDTTYHRKDTAEDGPPGYNDGSLAERMLADADLSIYIIEVDCENIGFLSFFVSEQIGIVEKFCIDPKYIGQGIGTQAWKLFEEQESVAKWQLETPDYSTRNHRFYEKCGFHKIGEKKYSEDSCSFIYEKCLENNKKL